MHVDIVKESNMRKDLLHPVLPSLVREGIKGTPITIPLPVRQGIKGTPITIPLPGREGNKGRVVIYPQHTLYSLLLHLLYANDFSCKACMSSSIASLGTDAPPILSLICPGLLAPTMAAVTSSLLNTHAMAS